MTFPLRVEIPETGLWRISARSRVSPQQAVSRGDLTCSLAPARQRREGIVRETREREARQIDRRLAHAVGKVRFGGVGVWLDNLRAQSSGWAVRGSRAPLRG